MCRRSSIREIRAGLVLVCLLLLGVGPGLGVGPDSVEVAAVAGPVIGEGPVDPEGYRVGPGDMFEVTVMGRLQQSNRSVVTPEGLLPVPPAGSVPVAGLTLAEARRRALSALGPFYHGVEIQISLLELRQFDVHVLGQVSRPGTYVVDGVTRVSAAIAQAGGFVDSASRRKLRILKVDGSIDSADVVRFEMLGDRSANPFVTDGDLIQVPVREGAVRVHGEVALPGEYEILTGEGLSDILAIAGGFLDDAVRDRVEIARFLEDDPSRTRRFMVDFSGEFPRSEEPDLRVESGDEIFVRRVPHWQLNRGVAIEGEVLFPGVYVIDEGTETLVDLIERAGGFTEDADLFEANLTRQSFESEAEDREFERLRNVPVADMTEDEYAYFKMRSRENRGRVVVDFVSLFEEGDMSKDILLRRGDIIQVPQLTRTVTVSGQIVNPGRIPFREGYEYRDYIREAGGFAKRASRGKVRVIKGTSGIWFDAGDTDLEPGDTIWIPETPHRDYWELFKDFMTVAAQLATVYLVVDSARGN